MRIVGKQNRSEIELDPETAFRRGRRLDAMLRAASILVPRGVTRGRHEYFQRLDEARMVDAARRINEMSTPHFGK